jgi:hypothetical protein
MNESLREACSRRHAVGMMSAGLMGLVFGNYAGMGVSQPTLTLPTAFKKELDRAGMLFDLSLFADFRPVRVLPNPDHSYAFAVAHKRLPFEARYTTRILPGGDIYMLEAFVMTSLLNMAKKVRVGGAEVVKPIQFDSTAVKEEFGADWGVTAAFAPSPSFSKYASGSANVIFRAKTQGIGYMIYLFDGEEQYSAVDSIFHAMRFRA